MDKSDIAEQIHDWAMKEMHFRPKGRHVNSKLPTVDDVQQLCRGQSGEALKYLVEHVFATQTVRRVKGNLTLHDRQLYRSHRTPEQHGENQSEERAALLEKHKELSYQLTSNLTAIGHVEKDLQRISKEILNTEKNYRESLNHIQDLRRKRALLEAYSQQTEDMHQTYSEYTSRIKNKVNDLTTRASKTETGTTLYSKEKSAETGGSQGLETICTKNVREASQVIASFLQQMLSGKFGDNTDLMNKRKELLWRKVELICSEHPPRQQLLSLNINTHHATGDLREKTAQVNIYKDAEKLRFKYEGGGHLKDMSSPPTVLQTVSQLLQHAHESNIERFLQTEKCKNNSWKLQQRLVKAKEPVLQHFERSYRGDPGALELAKSLLDIEIQIAASRANLRDLEDVSEQMKDQISQAMREKEILLSKYQKIQNFRKLADNKQNLIRVLVKQNLNARSRLENQQQKIEEYIQRAMSVHEPETRSHCAQLNNSVCQEVEAFANMHLPYLMFTVLESAWKVAVIDLSINRLHGGQVNSTVLQTLQTVMQLADCPAFKSPESLLESVVDLKQEARELENMLTHTAYDRDTEHTSAVEHIAQLSKEVEQHDAEQIQRLLPSLQKRLAHSTQALTECLHVKDTAQLWWEQPSQYTTPWIKVDDLNYQQWHDKWTVLVTRLRQLHIPKS